MHRKLGAVGRTTPKQAKSRRGSSQERSSHPIRFWEGVRVLSGDLIPVESRLATDHERPIGV